MKRLIDIFILLRLSHWSKALFVLLGVIYSGIPGYWGKALTAAFSFCLLASAVYIYNDLQDMAEDKLHPTKKSRPLASGDVSIPLAYVLLVLLLVVGIILAQTVSWQLCLIMIIYLIINLLYNISLRNLPVFDVLCIASGFLLRIFAGTIGIGLPITWWLAFSATLFSLFIALCKRQLEMRMGLKYPNRPVLRKYNARLLNHWMLGSGGACFLSYLIYVMSVQPRSIYYLFTLPFAAIGLIRFVRLTDNSGYYDDPVYLLFKDPVLRINLLFFFFLTGMALLK